MKIEKINPDRFIGYLTNLAACSMEMILKKNTLLSFVSVILSVLQLNSALAVEVFQTKTELRQYNPEKAYNGYTLFTHVTPRKSDVTKVFLIDMEGNVVHTWPHITNPKLYENGNLIGGFNEMDWNGNVVWEWEVPKDRYDLTVHHDTCKIYNKKLNTYTYIGLTKYYPTQEEAVAAGCDPDNDYSNATPDGIIEVDLKGNIIWEWNFLDHTIQDVNRKWPNYVGKRKTIADYPGKADLNWLTDQQRMLGAHPRGYSSDWQHTNALDYNEKLDHIAINAKHWSEFYVIDHGATFIPNDPEGSRILAASDKGDFIYRFGNPSAYQQGDPPAYLDEGNQQIYGAHDIQWIKKGLPGAGNFLIFNNGCYNPMGHYSEVLEINPFLDKNGKNTGNYVNPPDAGYFQRKNQSKQVVWTYKSVKQSSFYSSFISSCQRLPNGNTLIDSGASGHFFEVTTNRDVVWEYINPVDGKYGTVSTVRKDSDKGSFSVFRCYRYGPDYPGLIGRDLTPKGQITRIYSDSRTNSVSDSTSNIANGDK
jgi:hypothetical protein